MPTVTPTAVWDGWADDNGSYNDTASTVSVGSNSAIVNSQTGILFENVQIERGATVSSALLSMTRGGVSFGSTQSLIFDVGANKVANAAQPLDSADLRGRVITTAKVSVTIPNNAAAGALDIFDAAPAIQEIVNQSSWQPGNDILLLLRPTGGAGGQNGNGGRRMTWNSLQNSSSPTLSVTYSLPTVTGQMTLAEIATDRLSGTVNAEVPEPPAGVIAQGSLTDTVLEGFSARVARGDLSKNYPLTFLADLPDTHHFVTEAGEVYGFSARVPTLLGGIRTEMLGSQDDALYPASGLLTRIAAGLEFTAALLDRDRPRLDRDRLKNALKDTRALYLPDGRVFDLWHAQAGELLNDFSLSVAAAQKSTEPRHVLTSGTIGAAFETFGSTSEVPVYAVDPAGGLRADILPASVPQGAMCFGVRSAERGVEGYASVGRPVEADGTSDPSSITVSYRQKHLRLSLFGVEARVREEFLAVYGSVLVCYLFWRKGYGHLVTVSGLGVRHVDLPVGTVQALSERIITAGVRSDGVGFGGFIAPGAPSLDAPFFTLAVPDANEAEAAARALYAELTAPGVSYEVMPPDVSLILSRADSKALELAPGESLTFALAVQRVGEYTGALEFAVQTDTLTSSYTVTQTGDTDTYTVTLTAPVGTPEAAYTLRVTVKAQGADNEGSILKDVRDAFDAVVQVAAGPAIAPNATALYFANDPVQKRDAQMLVDSSANGNTLFWGGYARPNREFTALLPTGVFGAHVRSGVLANAVQAQRMASNQTYSFIFGDVGKSKDGTMVQIAADNSENGVHLQRSENGFKLRTVNGASTVTSLDTLTWRGGRFRPIVIIGTSEITLLDRDSGLSISLARPAWPDAGVRFCTGANRTAAGALSNLTRTYLYAASVHPTALSDIARRRNMDALQAFAPASDGKGEFPDNAIVIALWQSALGLYRNLAAPALGVTLNAVGGVTGISGGGIAIDNASTSHIFANTGVSSSEVVSWLTTILDFNLGVAYGAQIGVMDSAANAANATLTRHGGTQAFVMEGLSDLTHAYKTVGGKTKAGKSSFKSRVFNGGKSHELTELQTNEKGTVVGNVNWTGSFVLALGVIKRAGGGFQDKTNTKSLGVVMTRGEFSADDLVTSKKLLEG